MRRLAPPLVLGLLLAAGCFGFDEPSCSFKCGPAQTCPDDYECRSDGYCHKEGTTESCLFSDAATPIDMSVQIDEATPPDLSNSEGGSDDLGDAD